MSKNNEKSQWITNVLVLNRHYKRPTHAVLYDVMFLKCQEQTDHGFRHTQREHRKSVFLKMITYVIR
jgi:hypothetical protein